MENVGVNSGGQEWGFLRRPTTALRIFFGHKSTEIGASGEGCGGGGERRHVLGRLHTNTEISL